MNPGKATAGNSIYRAVDILSCVGNDINSVTGIAENCKLSKATVHRLLKILADTHLVERDLINHQYYVGRFITQFLSKPLITHEYLVRSANQEMIHLSTVTQESVHLNVISGYCYIILKSVMSKHTLRIVVDNEEIEYLHAGACGKVLLSQIDNKELRIALKSMPFEPFTENTTIHKEELMLQIKRIREQGYAISNSERLEGMMCVAAPITNYTVPVALSILGLEGRIKIKSAEIISELTKSSAIISDKIKTFLPTINIKPAKV
jgi:IclR family transcriptional regulator, KDG regulon repressor